MLADLGQVGICVPGCLVNTLLVFIKRWYFSTVEAHFRHTDMQTGLQLSPSVYLPYMHRTGVHMVRALLHLKGKSCFATSPFAGLHDRSLLPRPDSLKS